MNMPSSVGADVVANGREYARPLRPAAVIRMDGSQPAHIEATCAKSPTPNLERITNAGAGPRPSPTVPRASATQPVTPPNRQQAGLMNPAEP